MKEAVKIKQKSKKDVHYDDSLSTFFRNLDSHHHDLEIGSEIFDLKAR